MYDYLVVGSGLYGAIFAHEAKAHGKSVLVVDKRPNIAGNIYTENIEGINVHKYGAHMSRFMNTMFMGLSSLIFIYFAAPPKFMPNLCGIIAIHGHRCVIECCQQVLLDVPNLSAVFF